MKSKKFCLHFGLFFDVDGVLLLIPVTASSFSTPKHVANIKHGLIYNISDDKSIHFIEICSTLNLFPNFSIAYLLFHSC